MEPFEIVICAAIAVLTLATGFLIGFFYRKKIAEKKLGQAERLALKIVEDAKHEGEQKKKEALLEAKEEILKNKNEAEREIKERRNEVLNLMLQHGYISEEECKLAKSVKLED